MSAHDEDRIRQLLRQALPPVAAQPEPAHSLELSSSLEPSVDLWPVLLRRLDECSVARPQSNWVWFDWALLAGLAVLIAAFPATIPLLLYCL
jgi:hypothetical protein